MRGPLARQLGRYFNRYWLTFAGLVAVLLMVLSLAHHPASAQVKEGALSKADVVVDGHVIFQLGEIGNTSAKDRAKVANEAIYQALRSKPTEPEIDVRVLQTEQLTSIRVDEWHLLSITDSDLLIGIPAQEQAELWADTVRQQLQTAQWQRTPEYLQTVIGQVAAAIVSAILLYGVLRWQRKRLGRKWSRRSTPLSYVPRLIQTLLFCLELLVWPGLLLFVCERFPTARQQRYELFQFLTDSFTRDLFTLGEQSYSLVKIGELVFWSVVLWIVIRSVVGLFKERLLKPAIEERGLQDAIATLLQFCLLALGFFILLQAWGIDLSALTVLASFLGVGLGFGLQNIVNNFFSGWILLLERPVQVGDFINLGDVMGTVERIGSRSTEIRTPDRVSIIVPNSELIVSRVMNWSHRKSVTRLHLPLGISYNAPVKQFHHAVIEAALSHPDVLRYPHPQVRFLSFGESSLDFDLMVWIRDPRRQFDIKSDLYYMLEANLRHYQIEIPFPQRDVNVHIPNFESMVQTLDVKDKNGSPQPTRPQPEETPPIALPLNLLQVVTPYSVLLQDPKDALDEELIQLVEEMKGPQGVEISDRRFRTTIYPNCFVGREAVTWIVKTQKATHEEALRLGQLLLDKGFIHHVTNEHSFKDEYLFYRFYEDEDKASSHSFGAL